MINSTLITDYVKKFYGYGNYKSPIWFIVAEESGGYGPEEIKARLAAWESRGKKAMENCSAYYQSVAAKIPKSKREKIASYFDPENPIIHLHWNRYIRMALELEKNEDFMQAGYTKQLRIIKDYQLNDFATSKGNTALLFLRPLACPTVEKWPYRDLSKLEFLQSKRKYIQHIDSFRSAELRNKIQKFKPKYVIFFSLSQKVLPIWNEVAATKLQENRPKGFMYAATRGTKFAVAEHPVGVSYKGSSGRSSFGLGNDYFREVVKWLQKS